MHQIDDPCYKCKKRKVGCHSKCTEYIEWKEKRKEENESIQKERSIDAIIRAHISETVEWEKKHRHR